MHFKSLAGLAAVLAAASSVFAAEPVDVSPLVNDRTVAVAQVDLDQMKLRPAFDWALDVAKRAGFPADMLTPFEQGGAGIAMLGQPSVDALRRAGVSTLGVVLQFNDGPDFNFPPILLLAVPRTADPKKVTAALGSLGLRSGEKGDLVVFSPNLPPGVLAKMTSTDRPDLAVKTGGSALAAVFAISETIKADVLARNTQPDPDTIGFARDVKRYTICIDTAAGPHFGMVAETTSPDAAASLKQIILKDRPSRDGKTWASIAKALPLTVEGSNLVLDARQPEIDAFAKTLVPALSSARQTAMQVQSASNIRSLMQGAMLYAADHHGATAATLDELAKVAAGTKPGVSATLMTNPAKPELGTGSYVYVRAVENLKDLKTAAKTVAIYEAGDFGDGINVGFWDGHVEQIKDEATFKALLGDAAPAAGK